MSNTLLQRTVVSLLTNKSGADVAYGDVVILGSATAKAFDTTTTLAYKDSMVGVCIEPAGIANNATGKIATCGWVPQINLDGAASLYDLIQTDTVAGQGTPHAAPVVAGDFAIALQASATPEAILFGTPEQLGSSEVFSGVAEDLTTSEMDSSLVYAPDGAGGVVARTETSGSGAVAQKVGTVTGASSSGTTVMPYDDSIPQKTEGDEYMTLAITPTDAGNDLYIHVVVFGSVDGSDYMCIALFQDSGNDALAAVAGYIDSSTASLTIHLIYKMAAGTTSATTFKVRAGKATSGTFQFNGRTSTGRIFGGVAASSITIEEVVP
jgi:hypothetical protein